MKFRWKLVMLFARLLRVRMYEHWSEQPAYLLKDDDAVRCARCEKEAERNISGTPLCIDHDAEIRYRRLMTGIYGTIEPFEWGFDLSLPGNAQAQFKRYRSMHPLVESNDDLSDVSKIAGRMKGITL